MVKDFIVMAIIGMVVGTVIGMVVVFGFQHVTPFFVGLWQAFNVGGSIGVLGGLFATLFLR